jgi:hypothetical protein
VRVAAETRYQDYHRVQLHFPLLINTCILLLISWHTCLVRRRLWCGLNGLIARSIANHPTESTNDWF